MTCPRRVVPGTTYLLTRRCTQRRFMLVPRGLVPALFGYCIALAAKIGRSRPVRLLHRAGRQDRTLPARGHGPGPCKWWRSLSVTWDPEKTSSRYPSSSSSPLRSLH